MSQKLFDLAVVIYRDVAEGDFYPRSVVDLNDDLKTSALIKFLGEHDPADFVGHEIKVKIVPGTIMINYIEGIISADVEVSLDEVAEPASWWEDADFVDDLHDWRLKVKDWDYYPD